MYLPATVEEIVFGKMFDRPLFINNRRVIPDNAKTVRFYNPNVQLDNRAFTFNTRVYMVDNDIIKKYFH